MGLSQRQPRPWLLLLLGALGWPKPCMNLGEWGPGIGHTCGAPAGVIGPGELTSCDQEGQPPGPSRLSPWPQSWSPTRRR